MDLILRACLIKNIDKIEEFQIRVNEVNFKLVRVKLESEHKKIVNLFKQMKEQGLINSIIIPKNKRMKEEINKLVKIKQEIRKGIDKIKQIYR